MTFARRGMWLSALLAALLWSGQSHAEPATRFVIGSAPGGSLDMVARVLAESMGSLLHRVIVVDNRLGASGNIAADHVAKSLPDGYTVLLTYNVHPIAGALFPSLPFDPVKDFRSVGMIATTPYALVANPAVPGSTIREVMTLAKAQKRTLTFASPGIGTPQHLMMERLKQQTGADINVIQYKSAAPAQMDVVAGHLDLTLSTPSLAEPQVKAGKLKALGVTSSQRLPQFPDAPTVSEMGYGGFITDGWYAVLMPAKTPTAIIQAYNQALNEAITSPAVREKMMSTGLKPAPGKPEVLDIQIREDAAMWKKVISDFGIKPE